MEENFFYTLSTETEGFFKNKKSKFYGFAFPLNEKEDINRFLEELRKKFHDARHVCYAFDFEGEQRANDDGEPRHSAGTPILGQIKSFELKNVLVAVVRYFGGVKLGVSGLIEAYREAAKEAIENNEIIKIVPQKILEVEFEYDKTGEIMRLIDDFKVKILSTDYSENTKLKVQLAEHLSKEFLIKVDEVLEIYE